MKLKDVLLITNNNKGTEYKYLSSMEDYMAILLRAFEGSETELAHAVQELCQTKENNQSVVDQVGNMIRFARSQQIYPYRALSEWGT